MPKPGVCITARLCVLLACSAFGYLIQNDAFADSAAIPLSEYNPRGSITRLLADRERPYVYAIDEAGTIASASILRINTTTNEIDGILSIGNHVTDMAINYEEGRLYASNWTHSLIRVVDLNTWTGLPSLPADSDVNKINAGRAGRIYTEGGGNTSGASMRILDSVQGNVLSSTSVQHGDGELDPASRYYYHCQNHQNNSRIFKYDIQNDTFASVGATKGPRAGTRNLVLSADGQWVFWRQYYFDADLNELGYLKTEIYATTQHGEIAISSTNVLKTLTGDVLYTLPFTSSVMAVSGDQTRLYVYGTTGRRIVSLNMNDLAGLPEAATKPVPADGTTVSLPLESLAWSPALHAYRYNIYWGEDAGRVGAATPGSPEFLATTTDDEVSIDRPMEQLREYYWRVDAVGVVETQKGQVWKYSVAPFSFSPTKLALLWMAKTNNIFIPVILNSSDTRASWNLKTSNQWIKPSKTSGGFPDTLNLTLNVAHQPAGMLEGELVFTSGNHSVTMPIRVDLMAMNLTRMTTDYERPHVYALHRRLGTTDDFVVVFDTDTNELSRVLPIGSNATDFTVHHGEHRLYVTNWRFPWNNPLTRAIDLNTWKELPPYEWGNDVYKISAGKPGRVIIEGEDQHVDISILDTSNSKLLARRGEYEGDGEADPTGRYYYHCDAQLNKYDIQSDFLTILPPGPERSSGSRNLVMSGDGTRLFWLRYVYDADCVELNRLPEEIFGSSLHGDYAFGKTAIFNSVSGQSVYTYPLETDILAVAGDHRYLYLYNKIGRNMIPITLTPILGAAADLRLLPNPGDGEVVTLPLDSLSWSRGPRTITYEVYLGEEANAVAVANTSSELYLGSTHERLISLDHSLEEGKTYYWRVDAENYTRKTVGTVWSFTVYPLTVSPKSLVIQGMANTVDASDVLSLRGAPIPWTASTTADWLILPATSGIAPASLEVRAAIAGFAPGTYTADVLISVASATLRVPVTFIVHKLNLVKIMADPGRSLVYALHGEGGMTSPSYLLVYDATHQAVTHLLPAGYNATDAILHPAEGRIYIANNGFSTAQVMEATTYAALPPLPITTYAYRISAGRSGRLLVSEARNPSLVYLYNTQTGAVIDSVPAKDGDGKGAPGGDFYYHGDYFHPSKVIKYDLRQDTLAELVVREDFYFGKRNLVMSGNGQRLFWWGAVLNGDLDRLKELNEEIYATNHDGSLAFSESSIYDTNTGNKLVKMPFTSTMMAVTPDQQYLVYFDAAAGEVRFVSIKEMLALGRLSGFSIR